MVKYFMISGNLGFKPYFSMMTIEVLTVITNKNGIKLHYFLVVKTEEVDVSYKYNRMKYLLDAACYLYSIALTQL